MINHQVPWEVVAQTWRTARGEEIENSWQIRTISDEVLVTVYTRELADHMVELHNQSLAEMEASQGEEA